MPLKPIEVFSIENSDAKFFADIGCKDIVENLADGTKIKLCVAKDYESAYRIVKALWQQREDSLVERPKVLKGCGNTNPQIRCRQPYCDYCKALKNPHECIDCKDHFSDGQMTISTFIKANKQPQYREPTAEDVGKMVEVKLGGGNNDNWVEQLLCMVDKENGEYICFSRDSKSYNKAWKTARIKVEE